MYLYVVFLVLALYFTQKTKILNSGNLFSKILFDIYRLQHPSPFTCKKDINMNEGDLNSKETLRIKMH